MTAPTTIRRTRYGWTTHCFLCDTNAEMDYPHHSEAIDACHEHLFRFHTPQIHGEGIVTTPTKIRPLRVWKGRQHVWLGQLWHWQCRLCGMTGTFIGCDASAKGALRHLSDHTPVVCDDSGMSSLFTPAGVWCPLCDDRIANGIAEGKAIHVASEHWEWHLGELGRAS